MIDALWLLREQNTSTPSKHAALLSSFSRTYFQQKNSSDFQPQCPNSGQFVLENKGAREESLWCEVTLDPKVWHW